jgi:hypothetical protein
MKGLTLSQVMDSNPHNNTTFSYVLIDTYTIINFDIAIKATSTVVLRTEVMV